MKEIFRVYFTDGEYCGEGFTEEWMYHVHPDGILSLIHKRDNSRRFFSPSAWKELRVNP